MKSKNMLKKILVIGTAAMGLAQAAQADVDLEGSFHGRLVQGGKEVELIMHSLAKEGREGSYLGLLIREDLSQVNVYMIDPADDANEWDMQPRVVTSDGAVLGTNNMDPSLALQVTDVKGSRPSFTVTSANSSNHFGPQDPMTFSASEKADLQWPELTGGIFKEGHSIVDVGNELVDRETKLTLTLSEALNGHFKMREELTGVYMLKAEADLGTGKKTAQFPQKYVVFVHRSHFFGGDDFILLVNPNDGNDVMSVKHN